MATAQEILNEMEEGEEQNVIVIDSDLRTIRIPDGIKILGVESDDDVLRLHFKMPKMYGEFDLSTFSLRVNYLNANGDGDVFEVQDAAANGDELKFSWLVGRTAAQYKGDVKFIVCAKKVKEGGIVEKEFNTTPATLPVLEGLETIERVAQENPDVIEAIMLRLDKLEKNGGGAEPDATLTQSGKAADAKATGDELNALKEAIDDKLDASELPTAINTALEQAKESGQFDGAPGAKGDPGDDYVLTEADKEEIAEMAAEKVEVPEGGGSYTLPVASPDVLGGVKPVAKTDGMTQEIGVDAEGKLWGMPGGGGSANVYELLMDVTIEEEVSSVSVAIENPGIFTNFIMMANAKATEVSAGPWALGLALNVESSAYVNGIGYMHEVFENNAEKYAQGIYTLYDGGALCHYGVSANSNQSMFSHKWSSSDHNFVKKEISRVCAFSQNGKAVFGIGSTIKVWGLRA